MPSGGCGIIKVENITSENIKAGVTVSYGLENNTLTSVTGTFTSDANAYASGMLSGLSAYVNGSKINGTMANNGNVNISIAPSETYTIPAGYHGGGGKVSVYAPTDLPSADKILSGSTVWVHGITWYQGTMPNNGAVTATINPGGSYTIPAGYHNGSGKVTANSPSCSFEALNMGGGVNTGISYTTTKFYNFIIAFVGGADNSDRNTASNTGLSGNGEVVYNQNTYNTTPDTTNATRATVWKNVSSGSTISTYGQWSTGSYILGIVCG